MNPNDLVKFLDGRWNNKGIGIVDGKAVGKDDFIEILTIKDEHTLSIECEGLPKDIVSATEWHIELIGNDISIDFDSYIAKGHRENNVYYLIGYDDEYEVRHRIYTMGDKCVFHREYWKDAEIIQMDMSYLSRLNRNYNHFVVEE